MTREESKKIANDHAEVLVSIIALKINEAARIEWEKHNHDNELAYLHQAILETLIQKLEAKV